MQFIKNYQAIFLITLFSFSPIFSKGEIAHKAIAKDIPGSADFLHEYDNIENIDTASVAEHKVPDQEPMSLSWGNITGKFQIKYKPETFYGKNINLLNNANESDRILFSRSTLDLNLGLDYGKKKYDENILNFFATIRNKSTWGVPESIARTTVTRIKTLESLDSGHLHFLTRQIFWLREMWLRFSINDAFGLSFACKHYFTVGAFPFELGRGISLGAAYAVNPGPLGFFSDNSIDQYAFGFKLSGDVVKGKLTYDIYGSVLNNKGDAIVNTAENIYSQRFGFKEKPERGAMHLNFITAGRLRWFPIKTDVDSIIFEPYFLVGKKPECKVEFLADSEVILGTLGFASEFVIGNFEFGFDTARNLGKQVVFGWDRNKVISENFQSFFSVVNSDVVAEDPKINPKAPKVAFVPGSQAQQLIENVAQDQSQNGEQIGTGPVADPRDPAQQINLFNSLTRFRNGYSNTLEGWMLVFDGGYWFCDRQVRLAAGGGVASGDKDPNVNLEDPLNSKVDGNYKGFLGLQEIYTGNRIQSVFLLGGAGRIPRPLTCPRPNNLITLFPTLVSGFTNLIFSGGSIYYTSKHFKHNFEIRSNVLSYWQYFPTNKFDRVAKQTSPEHARNHLGVEVNTFFNVHLVKDFQFFAVGSVFIPGNHFKDIRGMPLNKEQRKILDRADNSGSSLDALPLLGADPAWTLNVGLEFRF